MRITSDRDVRPYKTVGDYHNNTNISLVHRYVYFAVDKVANSSIKNALYLIEYEPVRKVPLTMFDERASPLLSPYQVPADTLEQVYYSGEYLRFAFVRNPYTRLLSCYLDRIQTATSRPRRQLNQFLARRGEQTAEVDFGTFIRAICQQTSPQQNSHWREQSDDLLYGHIELDFIGRFENLWSDMAQVSEKIWGEVKPQMSDSTVNKSPRATAADAKLLGYYTPELRDLVANRFAKDFENFGYDTEITGL